MAPAEFVTLEVVNGISLYTAIVDVSDLSHDCVHMYVQVYNILLCH